MLERLEISIINFSQLNAEYRFEAEYFSKYNLNMMNLLMAKKHRRIEEFADVTDGIHTSIDYDEDSPVYLISATSPRDNYFNLSRNARISEKEHIKNPRTALKVNDVILSTVGTIGNCAVVNESILPANSDRHVGIIRVNSEYSSYVVSTYLLSKYGRMQTRRETTGNVQPNLFLYKIKEIVIPVYGEKVQEEVERIIIDATDKKEKAHSDLLQAEKILSDELGIEKWNINNEKYSERSLKEISRAGRLDSEYFQRKYDGYEEGIKGYHGGYTTPGEVFDHIKTSCLHDMEQYEYIEIGDIDISSGSYETTMLLDDELPANAKIMTKKGDILVSTVRPYRGAVSILKKDGILVSGAFTVLRAKNSYPAEVLQVLLRMELYKQWLLKYNVGTSYPVIKDEDILQIAIPVFDDPVIKRVVQKVNDADKMLEEAKEGYNLARTILEAATEKSETEALRLLKEL